MAVTGDRSACSRNKTLFSFGDRGKRTHVTMRFTVLPQLAEPIFSGVSDSQK